VEKTSLIRQAVRPFSKYREIVTPYISKTLDVPRSIVYVLNKQKLLNSILGYRYSL